MEFVTNFFLLPLFLLEDKTGVRDCVGEDTAFYYFLTVLKIFSLAWNQDEDVEETN